jgi:aryl-alcohol dehydrogenase-like predicted oxidoreductase
MIEQRIIENTNISVSNLGFGTGSLHHIFHKNERIRLLNNIYVDGVTHFDTSPLYGYGLSEMDLGFFLKCKNDVTVSTKIGLYPVGAYSNNVLNIWTRKFIGKLIKKRAVPIIDFTIKSAQKSIISSLQRLNREQIDFLFLHEPILDLIDTDEMQKFLELEIFSGRIRAYGIAGEKQKIEGFLNENSNLSLVIQTRDSLLNKESNFLHNYNRSLQFTYGYFSKTNSDSISYDAHSILKKAFMRNTSGCVLFSTKSINHFKQLIQ